MNKKISIYIIGVLIIIIGVFIVYNINNKTSDPINNGNQQNIQTQITPGPTGKTCLETVDCAGECGDNSCYVASCTKKINSDSGSCVCLQVCEE